MRNILIAYKLIWVRVVGYYKIPFLTVVLSQTETWSGQTWQETHPFIIARILIAAHIAGLTSIYAFIDQSLPRANAVHQQLSDADRAAIAAETTTQETKQ